jgi:hypothetical protein
MRASSTHWLGGCVYPVVKSGHKTKYMLIVWGTWACIYCFGIGDRLAVTAESNIHFPTMDEDCVMAHAVNTQFLAAQARIHSHGSPYGICIGQNGTGTVLSLDTWNLLC